MSSVCYKAGFYRSLMNIFCMRDLPCIRFAYIYQTINGIAVVLVNSRCHPKVPHDAQTGWAGFNHRGEKKKIMLQGSLNNELKGQNIIVANQQTLWKTGQAN